MTACPRLWDVPRNRRGVDASTSSSAGVSTWLEVVDLDCFIRIAAHNGVSVSCVVRTMLRRRELRQGAPAPIGKIEK